MSRVELRRRCPLRAATGAVILTLAAGCGGVQEERTDNLPPEDPGEPVHGGSITVALEAETNNYLPGEGSIGTPGTNVAMAIYDPLIRRDHEGNRRPYLAKSLEPNADFTVWTLELREGVEFHDGTPLDAEAIQWNFENLHKVPGSITYGQIRDVERVEVVGELTVAYHLSQTMVAFPDLLIEDVGWPASPRAVQKYGEDAGSHPVGTGPFEFVRWRRDDRLTVRRNEAYWQDELPYLDEIVFRPMPDEDSRLASLTARSIDAMQSLRQSIIAQLRRTPNIHRYEYYGNNGGGSNFNTERPPVDDVRVRRALAHALHQEALIEVLGGTHITPAKTHHYTQGSPWYSERAAEAWPRNDPERASELLEDYMHDSDRSDGKAPGDPVSLIYRCPPDPSLLELAQMYQAMWRGVGVEVELRQMESAAAVQATLRGDFMIACTRTGDELDPYITLSNDFGPPEEQQLNATNFTHPVIDENLEILRTETDFEIRYEAVERIMLLLAEQVPLVWTAATPTVIAVRPKLRNIDGWRFPDGTLGDGTPQALAFWGQVWLAEAE